MNCFLCGQQLDSTKGIYYIVTEKMEVIASICKDCSEKLEKRKEAKKDV